MVFYSLATRVRHSEEILQAKKYLNNTEGKQHHHIELTEPNEASASVRRGTW